MSHFQRFAIFLITLNFLISGTIKITNIDDATRGYAVAGLKLMSDTLTTYKINLPEPINPNFMILNIDNFLKINGLIMVICSLALLGGFKFPAWLLIFQLVAFNLLVHNPFISTMNDFERHIHTKMTLQNFMMMGGLFVILGWRKN